ncbi:50S ribosomal protein L11 methyltransferase [Thauera butanivorans]|jgi:ribosomal protein L11 methyltransferase|uniref:50S ribosomal protein L11 methyltransferase n=1 Tax=Thauera butanivorans TaxID=86174 RepID=UPI0008380A03|nr:50S ribosomal protein L11 methyltransferase [Thauera butanivorans]
MWISVTLQADAARAEALSDALMEVGALSVSIEDADAGTDAETPQFGEPGHLPAALWDHSRVIALIDGSTGGDALEALLAEAAQAAGLDGVPPYTVEEVAEQNWVQLTQSQFDPIRITGRLWIVPSWHAAPDDSAINIELDPGMAFGTGSHPTTRLCLEWLCDTVTPGCSLLDYGCGSGILAIAAAKLGAAEVLGIDIDEKAVDAARDNAERNAVAIRLQHSGVPLGDTFDLVVANILTNPLCVLAPAIAARVAPGGRVALSGVLETQAGQVIEAWAPFIALQVGSAHDGWIRLEGQRSAA